jgi:hypothetical protein
MPSLRTEQASGSRAGYLHTPGTPVAVLELLDASKMIWLVEVALPNPDLVGGAEYECLELPSSALVFDKDAHDDLPPSDAEILRTSTRGLGDDVAVAITERVPPRKLDLAA